MKHPTLWHRNLLLGTGLVIAFGFDQYTKFRAFESDFGIFLNVFKPVLGKQLFRNYDFAFSLQVPESLMYIIYAILLSWLMHMYLTASNKRTLGWAVGLIMVGALSNLVDRSLYGYVRDFIYIFWGNVFNVADLYIIAGIIALLRKRTEV